jgi:hypothetical protein
MALVWLAQHHRTFWGTVPMGNVRAGENGQRTALSTPNNGICNGHSRDAHGADLARRYYERELRSLSFPGRLACCRRSCCVPGSVVWLLAWEQW